MIVLAVLAMIVGPFVLGSKAAAVLALAFLACAAADPLGRRLDRRNQRRRHASMMRRLNNDLEAAWLRICAERNERP